MKKYNEKITQQHRYFNKICIHQIKRNNTWLLHTRWGIYPSGRNRSITLNKRNLRMDIAYMRSGNIINNIENQSYFTDTKKLEIIAEYAKFVLINNDSLIDSIIIIKIDPKYYKKEIPLK